MDNCKKELEEILDGREKAIEEFLEEYAEEKFKETQEIKKKYQTTLNFLLWPLPALDQSLDFVQEFSLRDLQKRRRKNAPSVEE